MRWDEGVGLCVSDGYSRCDGDSRCDGASRCDGDSRFDGESRFDGDSRRNCDSQCDSDSHCDGDSQCDSDSQCDGEERVTKLSLRNRLLNLYKQGDAAAMLSFIAGVSEQVKAGGTDQWDPLMLWVRPQPCCLQVLAAHVRHAGLSALASIGCGTGLLEWLISATTGLSVIGYEVNSGWWTSRYAPPTFIPLTFVDPDDDPPTVPPSHALVCCYFNNGQVFRQYVAAYKGPVLIIIGSVNGSHHTEPRPLDYVHVHPWILTHTHHISQQDLLACYVRDHSKEGMHREPSV